VDPHQTEQDEALRALVAAEASASDDFFTATSTDGTTVFHDGFGEPGRQREIPLAVLNGLVQRGTLTKTRIIERIDFGFAITEGGRDYIERLDRGDLSALDVETQRANRAEAELAAVREAAVDTQRAAVERRRKRADRLGLAVAAVIVILVGAVLFFASETPLLRVIFGIATFAGFAGVTFYPGAKRLVSGLAFRALTFIHERS